MSNQLKATFREGGQTFQASLEQSQQAFQTHLKGAYYVPTPGPSAYEVAVANGFEGTEEEWLASLVGPQGEPGTTPHIGENGNWFIGDADTGVSASGGSGGGGVSFTTDDTLTLKDGVLSVNTTNAATEHDVRPITAQGVYGEFAVINALLKTI